MTQFDIRPLSHTPESIAALSELLIETVAQGGSVSFMHPLSPADAAAFWRSALQAAQQGQRLIWGAWDGAMLTGTVTLLLDFPVNQPHRAEIAKMMTWPAYRGQGVARALLLNAEAAARERGRSLLMLDTASDGGAAGLYEKMGYTLAGEVPDFALKPHGGLTGTLFYWKRL